MCAVAADPIPPGGHSCVGDSGGFLGGRDLGGSWLVVGVTNFGECEVFGGFTNVAYYLDWITAAADSL